jgi:membrane protein DedA with SNARE-associated domain
MPSEQKRIWLPLAILAAGLVIWTGLLALGAYLEWGADQPRRDIRKPLFILGSLAIFLGVWAVALWLRARRLRRKRHRSD